MSASDNKLEVGENERCDPNREWRDPAALDCDVNDLPIAAPQPQIPGSVLLVNELIECGVLIPSASTTRDDDRNGGATLDNCGWERAGEAMSICIGRLPKGPDKRRFQALRLSWARVSHAQAARVAGISRPKYSQWLIRLNGYITGKQPIDSELAALK